MRVVVGRIGRAQGIRGDITVELRTDTPEERFAPGVVVFLSGRAGLPDRVTVAGHRWQNSRLILTIEGITDRSSAEALRGAMIEADVDLGVGADDEFHDLALVGLQVREVNGHLLGHVSQMLHLPAQDVLVVARTEGAELLVPFVVEMVPDVDLDGGFVVVDLPEGLAELS